MPVISPSTESIFAVPPPPFPPLPTDYVGTPGLPGAGVTQGIIGGEAVNLTTGGNDQSGATGTWTDALSGVGNKTTSGSGAPAQGGGGIAAWISDFFLRSVVIVVGMIFLAVGLSMFKGPATIIEGAKATAKKVVK